LPPAANTPPANPTPAVKTGTTNNSLIFFMASSWG
jgi:hypothetical protein